MNDDRLTSEAHPVTAGTIVIRLAGDFCGQGAVRMRRTLARELAGSPHLVILDLTGIARIDAEGIDTLRSTAEQTADEDIGLCLVAPARGAVVSCLDALEFTDAFEIFPSVSEALGAV